MTSDTPRSDAHYGVLGIKQVRGTEHDLIFARQLERELAEARAEVSGALKQIDRLIKKSGDEWERANRAEAKLAALGNVEKAPEADRLCREADGCPTEGAVLQREWRELTARLAAATEQVEMVEDIQELLGATRWSECYQAIAELKEQLAALQVERDSLAMVKEVAADKSETRLGNLGGNYHIANAGKMIEAKLAALQAEPDVAGLVALLNVQAAFPQDPRHRQVTLDAADALLSLSAQLQEKEAECEQLRTDLLGVKEYREKNPLGGPAKVFDAMADCVRAGDDFNGVLKEYGFVIEDECEGLKAEREKLLVMASRMADCINRCQDDDDCSDLAAAYDFRQEYPR